MPIDIITWASIRFSLAEWIDLNCICISISDCKQNWLQPTMTKRSNTRINGEKKIYMQLELDIVLNWCEKYIRQNRLYFVLLTPIAQKIIVAHYIHMYSGVLSVVYMLTLSSEWISLHWKYFSNLYFTLDLIRFWTISIWLCLCVCVCVCATSVSLLCMVTIKFSTSTKMY